MASLGTIEGGIVGDLTSFGVATACERSVNIPCIHTYPLRSDGAVRGTCSLLLAGAAAAPVAPPTPAKPPMPASESESSQLVFVLALCVPALLAPVEKLLAVVTAPTQRLFTWSLLSAAVLGCCVPGST